MKMQSTTINPLQMVRIETAVNRLAGYMIEKLQKNAHKGDWLQCDLEFLFRRLEDERQELTSAVESGLHPEEVLREAADVANFAMMIAECVESGVQHNRWVELMDEASIGYQRTEEGIQWRTDGDQRRALELARAHNLSLVLIKMGLETQD